MTRDFKLVLAGAVMLIAVLIAWNWFNLYDLDTTWQRKHAVSSSSPNAN